MGIKTIKKEGVIMIFIPESIKRILKRIENAYQEDLAKGVAYCYAIDKNGQLYTGTDAVRIQLENFKEFKTSLEDGTSELLMCEEGKEDEAKIRLMHAIGKFYEPLSSKNIMIIKRDVYVQRGLKTRIKKFRAKTKKYGEASNLLELIRDAHWSSWGQGDSEYEVRDLRLAESEAEFEAILTTEGAIELTKSKNLLVEFTSIRVALVTLDEMDIYQDKGIFEDYKRFLNEHLKCKDFDDAMKMFNLWHDVRETAIYYVYVPKE